MASVEGAEQQSVASTRDPSLLIHVLDGMTRSGRVRRVEYVRRYFDSCAIVVGSLDDECRCAGIGLSTIGSAPRRLLMAALARVIRDGTPSAGICAWSNEVAFEVASMSARILLIADRPPPRDLDRGRAGRIDVIAPDAGVARAWSLSGARRTRILPPCALAAGAPAPVADSGPLDIALIPPEGGSDEDAIDLIHRAGLVQLGGFDVLVHLDVSDPGCDPMVHYALQTGYGSSIHLMGPEAFPGDVQVALVDGVRTAKNDERILDLSARGVVVLAFLEEPCVPDESVTLETCGIQEFERTERNTGARSLVQLISDRSYLERVRTRARAFAATRVPRHWCKSLGVAARSLQE